MKISPLTFCLALSLFFTSCSTTNKNNELKISEDHAISKDAAYIISAKTIISDGGELTELNKKGQILHVVSKEEDLQTIQRQWNKRFYNNLLHHYIPPAEQLSILADIIKSKDATDYEVAESWPKELTEGQFDTIFNLISQDLIDTKPINKSNKGKYVIVVNPDFWTITTDFGSPLLVSIISTYEREFEDYELYHDDLTTAFYYGTIIFDMLCASRNPDNPYHYARLLTKQFDQLSPEVRAQLQAYNLNENHGHTPYNLPHKRTAAIYKELIENNKEELSKAVEVFTAVPNPPFYVVHL